MISSPCQGTPELAGSCGGILTQFGRSQTQLLLHHVKLALHRGYSMDAADRESEVRWRQRQGIRRAAKHMRKAQHDMALSEGEQRAG